ncbi:methyltransferase family protein [Streptomyces dysideae]|uniref:Isoprenylcysteine carboxylmethyltransferase family protein n=1 Tax=Streptomyces dysideae TaxID=909626 RepID=A0A101V1B1_9ACTN|nr:isoprenylcysteine carboxylmethyltransferase family protein [Streptomyces dysideae]KUO20685.1 hypothetical protein AQJ91_12205 [Streptomyces dysideae]
MKRLESVFPPLLFLSGLAALGHGLATGTGVVRVALGLYLVWTLLELRITFRVHPGDAGGDDAASMPLYGLARGAVVASAVFVPPLWAPSDAVFQGVALAVFVAGVVLRLGAIRQLGRFYSHKVRTLTDHMIVRSGPYRLVRHPAYSGMVVGHIGFVALLLNPVSLFALVGLLVPAIVHRIRVEERTLMELTGYPDYARGRKRLVPAVW